MLKAIEKLQDVLVHLSVNPEENAYAIRCLKEFMRANESDAKVGKLNIYDFVGKDVQRPVMTGVYYDSANKQICASDNYVLLSCKSAYNEDFANKVVNKKGEFIEGRYPNYVAVLKSNFSLESKPLPEDITTESLLEYIKTYKSLHKIDKDITEKNSVIMLEGELGITIEYAKLLVKFDLSKVKMRYDDSISKGKCLSCFTYEDEDKKAIFMPMYVNGADKTNKDRLYYPSL